VFETSTKATKRSQDSADTLKDPAKHSSSTLDFVFIFLFPDKT
jgi:hypothetical protein